jgi:hypothetical protein
MTTYPVFDSEKLRALEATSDTFPYVTGRVAVSFNDVIEADFEVFLDAVSEKLVGSVLLQDISYRVVGVIDDGTVEVEVTGDASMVLDDD